MEFTVWNPQTGKIISRGIASSLDEAEAYASNGNHVIIGAAFDPMTQAIDPVTEKAMTLAETTIPVTTNSVNVERDRRIALGFRFSGKLFHADMVNITGAMSSATAAVLNGVSDGDLRWSDPDRDFGWIAMDNTILTMDARTMTIFGQTAMAFVSSYMTAARAIKDRMVAGENVNIMDDPLWPSRTG